MAVLLLLAALPTAPQTVSAQAPTRPPGERALVLGGGAVTGMAWEVGLLKGLRDAGIDLTQADLIVGTSAGSVVGTLVRAGRSLDALYDAQLAPLPATATAVPASIDLQYLQETYRLWRGLDITEAQRVEVGRRALAAPQVIPEAEAIQQWATRLGVPDWPSPPLWITAVDVHDGTTRLIDQTQGVPIARAVAASTALPGLNAPVTIGERRYMDGGVAGTHLDAVAGYRLIVGVIPGEVRDRETAAARAQGSVVRLVRPDAESAAARGPNTLDLGRRRVSAEAGLRQAAVVAADLASVWNGISGSHY
jgi:NTE family protein